MGDNRPKLKQADTNTGYNSRWANIGTGCPESLCNLHPWRLSNPGLIPKLTLVQDVGQKTSLSPFPPKLFQFVVLGNPVQVHIKLTKMKVTQSWRDVTSYLG